MHDGKRNKKKTQNIYFYCVINIHVEEHLYFTSQIDFLMRRRHITIQKMNQVENLNYSVGQDVNDMSCTLEVTLYADYKQNLGN